MPQGDSHILSVHLEDYFQSPLLSRAISRRHWPRFGSRIETNTLHCLDILDRHDATATFFARAWVADHYPDLLREVARRGHEVAGLGELDRTSQPSDSASVRDDYRQVRTAIERATGIKMAGYRNAFGAPVVENRAAAECLARDGARYESNLNPTAFRRIFDRTQSQIRSMEGVEWSLTHVPLSAVNLFGVPIGATSGMCLRQVPAFVHSALRANRSNSQYDPAHFFFHVWELDPEQPRISAIPIIQRLLQYRNLEVMADRVEAVLSTGRFNSIAGHLQIETAAADLSPPVSERGETAANPLKTDRHRPKVSIVVPCYNEEETLPYLAATLQSFEDKNRSTLDLSFLLVDDGSSDRTWSQMDAIFKEKPNVALIRHETNCGIAAATMTGIQSSRDEIVCCIDADCSFDPHVLADMIPLLTPTVDLVQASPYHSAGGVMNVPGWRLILSKTLSRMYRRVLNHKFASYTACFRVYRRSAVKDLTLEDKGFLGIAEILIRLDQQGRGMVEFPAVLEARLMGASKMKTLSVIAAHLGMLSRLVARKLTVNAAVTPDPASSIASEKSGGNS